MKHIKGIAAIISLTAVIAAIAFVSRPSAPTPRFAPLAPSGQEVIDGGSDKSSGKGSEDQEEVVTGIKNDVSAPLSSIIPIEAEKNAQDADMNKIFTLPGRGTTMNLNGVSNISGVLPPDTNGDVGPNHYMQWVNLSFAIYSKTGALLYGPAAGNTLWAGFGGVCQTTNNGDPIVLYDQLADRWMVSQFAVPGGASGYQPL